MNKKYDIVFFVDMGAYVAINKILINIMLENKQEVYIPATELARLSSLSQDDSIDRSIRNKYKERFNLVSKLIKKGKFASFGNENDQNVDLLITQFLLKCTKNNVLVIVNEKKRKDNFLLLKGSYEHEGHYIDVAKVDDMKISLYDKKDIVEKLVSEDVKMVVIENSRQNVNENPEIISEPAEEEDILQQYRLEEPQEGEVLPESNDDPDRDKEYDNLYVEPSIKNKIRNNEGNNDGKEINFGDILKNGPVKEPEPGEIIEEEQEMIDEPVQEEQVVESEPEVVDNPEQVVESEPEVVDNPEQVVESEPDVENKEEVEEQENPLSINAQDNVQEEVINETIEDKNVVENSKQEPSEDIENQYPFDKEDFDPSEEDEFIDEAPPKTSNEKEQVEENNKPEEVIEDSAPEEAPQEISSEEQVEGNIEPEEVKDENNSEETIQETSNEEIQVSDNEKPDDVKEEDTSETPIDDVTPSDKEASEETEQPIDEEEKEEKDKKPFDEATANKFNF